MVFREGLSEPALVKIKPRPVDTAARVEVERILWKLPRLTSGRIKWPDELQQAFDACVASTFSRQDVIALYQVTGQYLQQKGMVRVNPEARCWIMYCLLMHIPRSRDKVMGVFTSLLD